jgi:NAD(P)-dependent dehydrogenase (short-subunit alcohol dehydrogenase family)
MTVSQYRELSGQVVLVTGASRGIGRGIALAFAEQGSVVAVNSRTLEGASEVVDEISKRGGAAEAAVGDVGDPTIARALVAEIIRRHHRLDVLVSNAAINPVAPLIDVTQSEWEEVQRVNQGALFHLGQPAAQQMIQQGGGSIVVIGSLAAEVAYSAQVPYCTSKAGVQMLAKGMAWEWASYGVRTNVVQPGWIETSLNHGYLSDSDVRDRITGQIPMRRFGASDEVASAALWLCSDGASYVNGATIHVDGGHSAGRPTVLPRRIELLQR